MKVVDWNNISFRGNIYNMKEFIKIRLALKVKALREVHSLTQEELADQCGVSWRTISNLERGLVIPDLCMLYKISLIFNTGIDEMLSLNFDEHKSRSRLDREQFVIEKVRSSNDKVLGFVTEQLMLIGNYVS